MAIVHRYGFPKNEKSENALEVVSGPLFYEPAKTAKTALFGGSSGVPGIGVAGSWLQDAPQSEITKGTLQITKTTQKRHYPTLQGTLQTTQNDTPYHRDFRTRDFEGTASAGRPKGSHGPSAALWPLGPFLGPKRAPLFGPLFDPFLTLFDPFSTPFGP